MRCLALAEQLRRGGAQVLFISRDYPGNAQGAIAERGFAFTSLPRSADVDRAEAPVQQWDEDAHATVTALNAHAPKSAWDWLLVDHYGLDSRWEAKLASHVGMIGVIDDLANRQHECDVLLDQNLHHGAASRYAGLVPERCRLFLGPRYALLRPEFAAVRRQPKPKLIRTNHTLCVSFGGTDPTNATVQVLRAVARADLAYWHVDVIVNESHRRLHDIERMSKHRGNCTVHVSPSDVASIVAGADFAVGGAGVSLWERCCLGVPSIIAAQAENQVGIGKEAARAGVAVYLGRAIDVSLARWVCALREWAAATRRRHAASRRVAALVDGAGAMRVAKYLSGTVAQQAKFRSAERQRCAC